MLSLPLLLFTTLIFPLDFWQAFGEAATRGRIKTGIFSMENLLVQLHISRRHGNPTNCPERRFWQYSCGNLRCRLCHQGPLDLRGHIRSSSAGLLGWSLLVQEPFDHTVGLLFVEWSFLTEKVIFGHKGVIWGQTALSFPLWTLRTICVPFLNVVAPSFRKMSISSSCWRKSRKWVTGLLRLGLSSVKIMAKMPTALLSLFVLCLRNGF